MEVYFSFTITFINGLFYFVNKGRYMPYPNEYAARINDPDKYKMMRRESNKFGQGIDVIFGITEGGKSEVQAIRFNKKKFSSEEVHNWLKEHKYSPIKVEEPSESKDAIAEAILFDKLEEIKTDVDQIDYFPLTAGKLEPTHDGFMKAVAPVAKVGIYTYHLPDGTIRRDLVDEETLFNAQSMDTLKLKPFTNDHPVNLLDVNTVKKHAVGTTGETIYKDGEHLMASLIITDSEAIEAVKNGKRQLSPGYKVNLLVSPGTYNGESFDVIQRGRKYNHLALCDKARGGDTLKLQIGDSLNNSNTTNFNSNAKGATMKFTINNVDYEITPEVKAYMDGKEKELVESLKTTAILKDNLDKANKTLQDTVTKFTEEKERTKLDHIVSLMTDSKEFENTNNLSNIELKKKLIKAKLPLINIDGKDDSYLNALVDTIEAQFTESNVQDQIERMTSTKSKEQGRSTFDSTVQRNEYIHNLSQAWQKDPRTGK